MSTGSDSYGPSLAGSEDSSTGHSTTLVADNLHPAADITRRNHWGNIFGFGDGPNNTVSCFVSIVGEPSASFDNGGAIHPLTYHPKFVKMVTRQGGSPQHIIRFSDDRTAIQFVNTFDKLKSNDRASASYTTAFAFCEMQSDDPTGESLFDLDETFHQGFDAQVILQIRATFHENFDGASNGYHVSNVLREHMYNEGFWYANSFGDVKACASIGPQFNSANPCMAMMHFEFHCPAHASDIVSFSKFYSHGWAHGGFRYWATYFDPKVFAAHTPLLAPFDEDVDDPLAGFRRRWTTTDMAARMALPPTNPTSPNRQLRFSEDNDRASTRDTHGHETSNAVLVSRIRDGTDIRTTVMLRNIPNRITKTELFDILFNWISGRIDFFYLRKDFRTGLNVGYCFLNFVDQDDLARFALEVQGFQWPNSEKHAEISYATMQGKESLVQKFRNSSVMREDWEFRPSLLYTRGHPHCGEEESFPIPDNLTKMERSCQNATTIGLFSPSRNRGAPIRGRRTAFDRGNSFFRVEELERENRLLRSRISGSSRI